MPAWLSSIGTSLLEWLMGLLASWVARRAAQAKADADIEASAKADAGKAASATTPEDQANAVQATIDHTFG